MQNSINNFDFIHMHMYEKNTFPFALCYTWAFVILNKIIFQLRKTLKKEESMTF